MACACVHAASTLVCACMQQHALHYVTHTHTYTHMYMCLPHAKINSPAWPTQPNRTPITLSATTQDKSSQSCPTPTGVKLLVYNSSGGRGCGYGISQMEQKHAVEDVFKAAGGQRDWDHLRPLHTYGMMHCCTSVLLPMMSQCSVYALSLLRLLLLCKPAPPGLQLLPTAPSVGQACPPQQGSDLLLPFPRPSPCLPASQHVHGGAVEEVHPTRHTQGHIHLLRASRQAHAAAGSPGHWLGGRWGMGMGRG